MPVRLDAGPTAAASVAGRMASGAGVVCSRRAERADRARDRPRSQACVTRLDDRARGDSALCCTAAAPRPPPAWTGARQPAGGTNQWWKRGRQRSVFGLSAPAVARDARHPPRSARLVPGRVHLAIQPPKTGAGGAGATTARAHSRTPLGGVNGTNTTGNSV